jgi:nucleotide-binding universal stress UspA family protein
MIKTILVPTDGSDHARKALALACGFAEKYGARLVLVHVLLRDAAPDDLRAVTNVKQLPKAIRVELERVEDVPLAAASLGGGYVAPPIPTSVLEAVGERILDAAKRVAERSGVKKISFHVAEGDPAAHILDCAKREKADMIVMGKRGLGSLQELFIGSVSHKVGNLAACPCMTVK